MTAAKSSVALRNEPSLRRKQAKRGHADLATPRAGIRPTWPQAIAGRLVDMVLGGLLLLLLAPPMIVIAVAIKLDSRGPVLFGCRRAGLRGREFTMLKFRKMADGACGPPLTAARDARFTRVGRILADTKLDELPQLLNVLRGDMSLVGPRPEDPVFVRANEDAFALILAVRPGVTGLSQLAFAKEAEILAGRAPVYYYVSRVLPQKLALDRLYVARRTMLLDARILGWTAVAVIGRKSLAVDRRTGALSIRRRVPRTRSGIQAAPRR